MKLKTESDEDSFQQDNYYDGDFDHDGKGELLEDYNILENSLDDINEDEKYFNNFHIPRRTNSDEGQYGCDLCNKTFLSKNGLVQHKIWHAGEKPYSCNVCDKKFTQKSNLTKHRRVHTGEKLFTCDICYKAFSTKFSLNSHKLIHTGEKPFSCDVCGKAFNKTSSLRSHKKHNHKKLDQSDEFNNSGELIENKGVDPCDILDSGHKDNKTEPLNDLDMDIKEELFFHCLKISVMF